MVSYDARDRFSLKPMPSEKLSIGLTIRDTSRVIGRAWIKLYGLSLIVLVVSLPFSILFAQKMTALAVRAGDPTRVDLHPKMPDQGVFVELAIFYAVQFLVSLYVYSAVVDAAARMLESGRIKFSESLKSGLARLLPMLVAAIVYYIALVVGFVLLFVPGVLVGAVYGLAPTLCVIERRGPFASFSRSADLTRDNRWRCIGVTLLVYAIPGIAIFVINKLITSGVGPQYSLVVSVFTNFLVLPIFYVFPAVLAFDLRRLKEGGGASAVADVF